MFKLDLGRKVDFWFKWGIWSYQNQDAISSGLEEINGSKKSDFKVQLKIRL